MLVIIIGIILLIILVCLLIWCVKKILEKNNIDEKKYFGGSIPINAFITIIEHYKIMENHQNRFIEYFPLREVIKMALVLEDLTRKNDINDFRNIDKKILNNEYKDIYYRSDLNLYTNYIRPLYHSYTLREGGFQAIEDKYAIIKEYEEEYKEALKNAKKDELDEDLIYRTGQRKLRKEIKEIIRAKYPNEKDYINQCREALKNAKKEDLDEKTIYKTGQKELKEELKNAIRANYPGLDELEKQYIHEFEEWKNQPNKGAIKAIEDTIEFLAFLNNVARCNNKDNTLKAWKDNLLQDPFNRLYNCILNNIGFSYTYEFSHIEDGVKDMVLKKFGEQDRENIIQCLNKPEDKRQPREQELINAYEDLRRKEIIKERKAFTIFLIYNVVRYGEYTYNKMISVDGKEKDGKDDISYFMKYYKYAKYFDMKYFIDYWARADNTLTRDYIEQHDRIQFTSYQEYKNTIKKYVDKDYCLKNINEFYEYYSSDWIKCTKEIIAGWDSELRFYIFKKSLIGLTLKQIKFTDKYRVECDYISLFKYKIISNLFIPYVDGVEKSFMADKILNINEKSVWEKYVKSIEKICHNQKEYIGCCVLLYSALCLADKLNLSEEIENRGYTKKGEKKYMENILSLFSNLCKSADDFDECFIHSLIPIPSVVCANCQKMEDAVKLVGETNAIMLINWNYSDLIKNNVKIRKLSNVEVKDIENLSAYEEAVNYATADKVLSVNQAYQLSEIEKEQRKDIYEILREMPEHMELFPPEESKLSENEQIPKIEKDICDTFFTANGTEFTGGTHINKETNEKTHIKGRRICKIIQHLADKIANNVSGFIFKDNSDIYELTERQKIDIGYVVAVINSFVTMTSKDDYYVLSPSTVLYSVLAFEVYTNIFIKKGVKKNDFERVRINILNMREYDDISSRSLATILNKDENKKVVNPTIDFNKLLEQEAEKEKTNKEQEQKENKETIATMNENIENYRNDYIDVINRYDTAVKKALSGKTLIFKPFELKPTEEMEIYIPEKYNIPIIPEILQNRLKEISIKERRAIKTTKGVEVYGEAPQIEGWDKIKYEEDNILFKDLLEQAETEEINKRIIKIGDKKPEPIRQINFNPKKMNAEELERRNEELKALEEIAEFEEIENQQRPKRQEQKRERKDRSAPYVPRPQPKREQPEPQPQRPKKKQTNQFAPYVPNEQTQQERKDRFAPYVPK